MVDGMGWVCSFVVTWVWCAFARARAPACVLRRRILGITRFEHVHVDELPVVELEEDDEAAAGGGGGGGGGAAEAN